MQYQFKVSFLEIYNEVIRDLLGSGKDDGKHDIRMLSASSSEVYVTDLTTVSVNNKEQVCVRGYSCVGRAVPNIFVTPTNGVVFLPLCVCLCLSDHRITEKVVDELR